MENNKEKLYLLTLLTVELLSFIACNSSDFKGNSANSDPQPQEKISVDDKVNVRDENTSKDGGSDKEKTSAPNVAIETDSSMSIKPLIGLWNAQGYTCPDNVNIPNEILKIEEINGKFLATKVTGDDCVKAGTKTFEGTREGNKIRVHFYEAIPGGEPKLDSQEYEGTFSPQKIQFTTDGELPKIVLTHRN